MRAMTCCSSAQSDTPAASQQGSSVGRRWPTRPSILCGDRRGGAPRQPPMLYMGYADSPTHKSRQEVAVSSTGTARSALLAVRPYLLPPDRNSGKDATKWRESGSHQVPCQPPRLEVLTPAVAKHLQGVPPVRGIPVGSLLNTGLWRCDCRRTPKPCLLSALAGPSRLGPTMACGLAGQGVSQRRTPRPRGHPSR